MPAVRCTDGGNVAGVPRGREPVVDCGADGAPPDRKITGTLVSGDEEQQSIAARDCPLERSVDGPPCTIEAHSMKIDDAVRLDRSIAKAPVPAAIEARSRSAPFLAPGNPRHGYAGSTLRSD
jgi:hypothetical protein